MKNKILFLIGVSVLSILTACSKFTDTQVLGQQTQENFFNAGSNAIYAVNSCYDNLKASEGVFGAGHCYEFMFSNLLSDDGGKGSTAGDFPELSDMKKWSTNSGNGSCNSLWKICYNSLYRCNTVLKNLPNAAIDASLKTRLVAEVKFLRAYYYLRLVKTFGPVPLFTEPVSTTQFHTVRASIAEVYKQIDKDLTEAAADLPERSVYASSDLGRATRGAANAYLARSIMYQLGTDYTNYPDKQAGWKKVYDLCAAIQASGQYSLMPNYAMINENEGENCAESIFEIQCAENPNKSYGTGKWGNEASVFCNPRGDWGGWGFDVPLPSLVNEFEANDIRLKCTVVSDGDYCYGLKMSIATDQSDGTGNHNRKVLWEPGVSKPKVSTKESQINIRQFRYADILLMKAEAAYNLSNEAEARTLVNMIRARARTSTMTKGSKSGQNAYLPPSWDPATSLPDVTASGADLLKAIWHERRVELGMEYVRYMDLVRTGRYLSSLAPDVAANCLTHCYDYKGNKIPVMPINVDEATAWINDDPATGIMKQNPGY